jgi:hypothetical protein
LRDNQVNTQNDFLYGVTNWVLFVAGLANLAAGTWWAWNNHTPIASAALTAGLVLLFAATIERFESLKGLGLEAKTRELDRKIGEADDALKRLRDVAELTSATLITLNSRMGRLDSVPAPVESYELAQRVKSILRDLKSEPAVIRRILEPWALSMCGDITMAILSPLHTAISTEFREINERFKGFKSPIDAADKEWQQNTAYSQAMARYQADLRGYGAIALRDYPEALIPLIDAAPVGFPANELRTARERVAKYADGMRSIQETFTLQEPGAWFVEIEAVMNPQPGGN